MRYHANLLPRGSRGGLVRAEGADSVGESASAPGAAETNQ